MHVGKSDIQRLVSRIHAGSIRQNDFLKVVENFARIQRAMDELTRVADKFESASVRGLLRTAPDLSSNMEHIQSMYTIEQDEKTITILPSRGADPDCDEADEAIEVLEAEFDTLLQKAKKATG